MTQDNEQRRFIPLSERSEGYQAVVRSFATHLYGIANYQPDVIEIQKREDSFREAVLSNSSISLQDITDFIVDKAFGWDLIRRVRDSLPSDD